MERRGFPNARLGARIGQWNSAEAAVVEQLSAALPIKIQPGVSLPTTGYRLDARPGFPER